VYLAEIPEAFAEVLTGLIGPEAIRAIRMAVQIPPTQVIGAPDDLDFWERRIEEKIETDTRLPETDRQAIVNARRGQGLFKQRVMVIERRCRVTLVENPLHLIASHCKPWRDATNEERLDGENGLLLTPSIDHLFDRGFISFEDSGEVVISPVAHRPSLQRMGVPTDHTMNVGTFSEGQRKYLDFHRNAVLLRASIR
jgi:putative restriction endonuclease